MTVKLWEISDRYKNVFDLLDNEEFANNEDVKNALDEVEGDFKEKLINCGVKKQEFENDSEIINKEIKRLMKLKKSADNKANSLKEYIKYCLSKMTDDEHSYKVETPLFKVNLGAVKYNKVAIEKDLNIQSLPDKFKYVKYEVNKTAIKEALLKGEHVDGAYLEPTRTLTIG